MAWIDHLPEVGDSLKGRRDKVAELSHVGLELERRIIDIRYQVESAKSQLLASVASIWTLHEGEQASRGADALAPRGRAIMDVTDSALRAAVHELDGDHTAVEAIISFSLCKVVREGETATDVDQMRATIERVCAWWRFSGEPVMARLSARRGGAQPHVALAQVSGE